MTTTEGAKKFTWAEIEESAAKKKTIEDVVHGGPAYVVIHNKVYDLGGDFVKWHPGGAVAISQLGRDASGAFEVFHTENAQSVMSEYYVGDLADSEIKEPTPFAKDLDQLRETISKMGVYESSKIYYAWKILSNLILAGTSIAILSRYGTTSTLAVVIAGFFMALFWQQCGWLAHDFLHHQVFKYRPYNDAVGFLVGNVFQGFSVNWWKNKHCTHHSVPNVHTEDPDIDTMPFLAWSEHALEFFTDFKEADVARFMVAYQPVLFFPILAVARLAWCTSSIRYNLNGRVANPTVAFIEIATLALHWILLLGISFGLCNVLRALLFVFVAETACGVMLAIVFTVNHNGMPVFTSKAASKMNFYELQIVTGRDVEPTHFANWFTGGLNYQIEHHCFPSIPRHQFYRVAPLVESLCKKHGVVYHKTSLWGGLGEILGRLTSISRAASKIRRG
ncbi:hypothetical protein HDU76_004361 [Blyttiomyces sp. JEL0837]|nr:hypothetical protein HDU76_004361 [Blyttiomyces sp. JEL0837]